MERINNNLSSDIIITQGVLPRERKNMSDQEYKKERKNFMFGRLEVNPDKKEELKYVRDLLMNHKNNLGNYEVVCKKLMGLSSMVNSGYSKDMVNNILIYKQVLSSNLEDDIVEYLQKEYRSIYLNSILLFTSLLNDFSVSKYDGLVKQFIDKDIYTMRPIGEIWDDCSKKMTNLSDEFNVRSQLRDWKVFRTAVKTGCIRYEVLEKITPSDRERYQGVFGLLNHNSENLDKIAINNSLILGDNYYLRKQKRR